MRSIVVMVMAVALAGCGDSGSSHHHLTYMQRFNQAAGDCFERWLAIDNWGAIEPWQDTISIHQRQLTKFYACMQARAPQ